ncbi:MAG TPA: D-aminoacylase [Gemmatimonadota bacterium]|nr:D-aminoacylase [Gemmatimonadota bacterium]
MLRERLPDLARPLPRRRFLQAGGSLAVSAALGDWSALGVFARDPLDLLLVGGRVVDGTGAAPFAADVGIRDGRIVAVERLVGAAARETLDVSGLVVAPGFIDIHGHTDLGIFVDNRADSKIRQGVTTEVVGQDGSSTMPVDDRMRAARRDHYRERYGVEIDPGDWEELFAALESRGMLANFVTMVGSGTVRAVVVGESDRAPSTEELAGMVGLVEQALAAGAAGISSGLEYVPNAFASTEELAALAAPAAAAGLPYATHMRNEADQVEEALAEAIAVAEAAGGPLQVSHLKAQGRRNWPKAERLLATIESAARERPVRFDRYPYTAYSTGLSSLFPAWAKDGGTEAFLARLADPAEAPRLRAAVDEKIAMMGDWDAIQIVDVGTGGPEDAIGRRLGGYAEERSADPYAVTVEILTASRNRSGIVGHGMSEENTTRFLAHPLGAICSDAGARRTTGPLSEGSPHPRAYGSYPRVLGKYVREERAMSLEEAVRKMTSLPAEILRLADRGTVAVGKAADVVVFDPVTVADTATFEAPHSYPIGVPYVVVGGQFAVRNGDVTGEIAGRVLSPV